MARELRLTLPVLPTAAKMRSSFIVTVIPDDTGKPLAGVTVCAYTDRVVLTGVQDVTESNGVLWPVLPAGIPGLQAVEVDGPFDYWATYARRVVIADGSLELRCPCIDLAATDVLDRFGLRGAETHGQGW